MENYSGPKGIQPLLCRTDREAPACNCLAGEIVERSVEDPDAEGITQVDCQPEAIGVAEVIDTRVVTEAGIELAPTKLYGKTPKGHLHPESCREQSCRGDARYVEDIVGAVVEVCEDAPVELEDSPETVLSTKLDVRSKAAR